MFLNEGEKENFLITERVLESSKKKKKREREGARERELLERSDEWGRMREKNGKIKNNIKNKKF